MDRHDTIAAIATAPGAAGVAVVRVSGPEAPRIAETLCGRAPRPGVQYADFTVDRGLVLLFKAPHSYTGEDVVEFQCHGGSVTPRRVLEACLGAGARLARRGEFTERAFLNGKLDYAQAASVLALIEAKTARAADAALEGLSGRVQKALRALYDEALDLTTTLEHTLDVSEDEIPEEFFPTLRDRLAALDGRLRAEIARARAGRILRDGALVVLAGPPNAGKSSLLNALLGEDRAIVSDVPGTTRDSIEAWVDLDGWPVRLVDTAGLRETGDAIEAEGVRRSEELIARADLVLGLDCAKGLRIHSKCDLGRGEGLNVSARTGEGLDELRRTIVSALEARAGDQEAPCASDERDVALLIEAEACLPAASGVSTSADPVVLANALREAAGRLALLVGASYSEDMLDRLFSKFCVGK